LKNLTAKTIHGVSWNLIATVVSTVLQIGYTAVMARLLTPSDFGLMAMAMVVIKFGDYFSKMGMAQALVQKPDLNNDDIRSVFTTSVIMGLIFTAIMYFFAPLFKYLFESEQVVPVIEVLSINFMLKGLSITSLGLLGKELKFKKLAIINMTTFLVCNIGIGVYLAYDGFGVFSLVYAGISQQIIMLLISYVWTRHDIRPLVSWKVYKPLLSFGGRISIISIFEYIGSSLDTFFIAKFHGALNVGLYNKARMLVYLPTYKLTTSVSRVIYPAFSKLQNNKEKLGKAYLSTTTLMSAVLFPICFGVFSASREIVIRL
jgi:O-antigen/teichoic acid export membrane protein